jgi:molecular chaperone GrpE (heat shock protein)
MRAQRVERGLDQITKLLEEVVNDNTTFMTELRGMNRNQQSMGADVDRAVAALRDDLTETLRYHALRDLCTELIGPLTALEAMLERADFTDPEVMAGHLRSLSVTLRGVLARMGAEKVPVVVGEDRYDPTRHRCVGVVDAGDSPVPYAPPHTVVRVVEDGYVLDHRPLSPVHVEIQSGRTAPAETISREPS